jgi:hypothetical protein
MMTPLLTTRGVSTGPLMPVVIFHDERPFTLKGRLSDESEPQLRRVYECQADADADVMDVLETCFEEFNVGEDSPVAQEYRLLGLRSLSTADVVLVGEVAYRCDSFGWSRCNPGIS